MKIQCSIVCKNLGICKRWQTEKNKSNKIIKKTSFVLSAFGKKPNSLRTVFLNPGLVGEESVCFETAPPLTDHCICVMCFFHG